MIITHPIPPLYDERSSILILGSFPSVKSREGQFFYHHPQNRFWKVIATVCEEDAPQTIEEKRALLSNHRIALWDVIHSCEITGSSDSSIRNVTPNDLCRILTATNIRAVFANGQTAGRLYAKYCRQQTGVDAAVLPSTSPANARCSFEELIRCWSVIKDFIF